MEKPEGNFGYPAKIWDLAKEQGRSAISKRAQLGQTMTYQDLTREISSITFNPDDFALKTLLGEISTEEDSWGRGMLTVLVVHKTGDKMPGNGFFKLAAELGRNTSDRERLWSEELKKVCAAWGYIASNAI